MDEPEEEAIEEPTTGEAQAERETSWFVQEWAWVASISILFMLALGLALLEISGLTNVLGPLGNYSGAALVLIVGVLVIGSVFAWRRWRG